MIFKCFKYCVGIGVFVAFLFGVFNIPPRYLPWTPLNLNDPVNFSTSFKLKELKEDSGACALALATGGIEYDRLPDKTVSSCTLTNRINLKQSLYPYSAAVRPNCALAAALVLWEREVVQKAAALHLESDIARINHYGIFSCRNISGSSRISQHASASAIDISGFTLKNGRSISVHNAWGDDSDEGRFLNEVHAQSCSIFNGVLGPNYNAAHADHFHLDLGPYRICR